MDENINGTDVVETSGAAETGAAPVDAVKTDPVKAEPVKADPVKTDSSKLWYESLSEEYKVEAAKYKTLDDFAKSKKDLKGIISKRMEDLTDTEFEVFKERYNKTIGIPTTLEEYNINTIAKNAEEANRVSDEILEGIKEAALKSGMTNEQAQAVYEMANALSIKAEKGAEAYHDNTAKVMDAVLRERYGKELDGHRQKIEQYIALTAKMYGVNDIFGVDNDMVMSGAVGKDTELRMDDGKYKALFFALCERHAKMAKEKSQGYIVESRTPYASKRRIEDFMRENAAIMRNASHPDYVRVQRAYQELMDREHQNAC